MNALKMPGFRKYRKPGILSISIMSSTYLPATAASTSLIEMPNALATPSP